ncbi:hypothetical protein [Dictyobacter halimunensis]|uniref:hypothetical protein n=1 Tax=Dictyobacter halimunensis TaxID=3026934 RepID=UPI0030C66B60
MHSQEQRFKYDAHREKLVVTQPPRGDFFKKLLVLFAVIALSIVIEIFLSQMMYGWYREDVGIMGIFLIFVSFSLFDLFVAWIIFARNVSWKAKFRLLLAAISILLIVLHSFISWAAYTSFRVFLIVPLTLLFLNLITNLILNRFKKKSSRDYPVDL